MLQVDSTELLKNRGLLCRIANKFRAALENEGECLPVLVAFGVLFEGIDCVDTRLVEFEQLAIKASCILGLVEPVRSQLGKLPKHADTLRTC